MTRTSRKYVLDSQLFINAFRDADANEALQLFHRVFAPFEHLSVIVAQELRAGVRAHDRKALERHVLKVYERANRTITPSADAWHRSGNLLADMARKEGLEIARVSKAFVLSRTAGFPDVPLAVVQSQRREAGARRRHGDRNDRAGARFGCPSARTHRRNASDAGD